MVHVAVIGGGIVGSSAAYHLAQSGATTVLIDNSNTGKATLAGAGIVAPGTSLRPLPAFFDLAKPAVARYQKLVTELEGMDIHEHGYKVCGKLMVADSPEKAMEHATLRALFEQRKQDGMGNIGAITDVSPTEAQKMLPILGDVEAAMHIAGAARVDGGRFAEALTRAALKLGATVISGESAIEVIADRVVGVRVGEERIAVDAVVIAAGAWSNTVLTPTGFQLALAPQKGQIVHIDLPNQDVTEWPILDWRGSQYQLCFGPNRIVCGATREFGSGFDTRVTPAGVKEILDEQLRLCPGLADGTIAEIRVGLRPYSDDVLPFIGVVPGFQNIAVSTGHGPSGLQLGPYSGQLAAELAQRLAPSTNIYDFRLDRPITKLEA